MRYAMDIGSNEPRSPAYNLIQMSNFLSALLFILTPLIFIGAVVNYLVLETQPQRIRRLRATGMTQKAIAAQLGITVYRVRKALA